MAKTEHGATRWPERWMAVAAEGNKRGDLWRKVCKEVLEDLRRADRRDVWGERHSLPSEEQKVQENSAGTETALDEHGQLVCRMCSWTLVIACGLRQHLRAGCTIGEHATAQGKVRPAQQPRRMKTC